MESPNHRRARSITLNSSPVALGHALILAARGESPTAFERRCIPPGCVAPPSNIPDILGRYALPAGRLAVLGATPDFHHGLLGWMNPSIAGASVGRTRLRPATPGKRSPGP